MCDTQYARDSYDRYGDDLCELLLSYLPISDCFRLECVSRQWRRLVYNKQHKLLLSFFSKNRCAIKKLIDKKDLMINETSLASVLKKCAFINDIIADKFCDINENILNIIADNCRHLSGLVIESDMSWIEWQNISSFAQKCGQNLRTIYAKNIDSHVMRKLLRFAPNITGVHFYSNRSNRTDIEVFIDHRSQQTSSGEENNSKQLLLLSKLFDISPMININRDFIGFADQYCKQIKKMRVCYDSNGEQPLNQLSLSQFFAQLSRFEALEGLQVSFHGNREHNQSEISDGLKLIGAKCTKINHLIVSNDLSTTVYTFGANHYRSLRKLEITQNFLLGTIQYLSGCSQLKQLTLRLYELSLRSVKNISEYLPLLALFRAETTVMIADNTLHCLAKCRALRELIVISHNQYFNHSITDDGICDVINNCPLIQTIVFDYMTKSTEITINALIVRAKHNPKLIIKYYEQYKKTKDNTIGNRLPNNLIFN